VNYKLNAATRALSGDRLRAALPIIMQSYTQGPFVAALAQQGRTVDHDSISRLIAESTGTQDAYSFVRPMTPEEQQAMQAQAQQQQQSALAKEQLSSQTRLQIMQMKSEGEANAQAEKSAVEILKLVAGEKALDKELRAKALEAALKLGQRGSKT